MIARRPIAAIARETTPTALDDAAAEGAASAAPAELCVAFEVIELGPAAGAPLVVDFYCCSIFAASRQAIERAVRGARKLFEGVIF